MSVQGYFVPALENKPTLPLYLIEYISAFEILNDRRSHSGFGPLPIQLSEIKAYLDIFSTDDVERFIRHVSSLDNKWLEIALKREDEDGGQKIKAKD